MTERSRDALSVWAALLLGLAAFLVFAGWWVLLPTNIAWLNERDRAMHMLGWLFFRDAPWGVPPGDSPHLGIELASSIALVDGLPLFAIPLKLFAAWLPQPFQYWGYWWLCCFCLQSLFGYRLARELGASRPIALIAGGFALITPAFLFRISLHMALGGHWLILAGLALYARRVAPRPWMWPLLIGLSAAIHAYLFVMVGGLWVAAWLQRLWLRRLTRTAIIVEPIASVLAALAVLWAAGFFYTGTLGGVGYGFFRLNLLWPIISQGWSRLIPGLPHSDYDYEGLGFLGIGVFGALLLAIATGAIVQIRSLFTRRWLPLLLVCAVMALFALSNVPGLLGRETVPIPLPGPLLALGAMFRSTGRFVWPLLYLITVGAIVLAARRLPLKFAAPILALLFAVQIADSSWAWSAFRRTIPVPADTWTTPLVSPFWDRAAAAGYTRIRAIPVIFSNPDWKALEYEAWRHQMDIDAIYLGRVDTNAVAQLNAADDAAIVAGTLEPKTLYSVDLATARRLALTLKPDDLLAIIDKRIVFAQKGAALVDGLGIDPRSGLSATPWLPPGLQLFVGL
ncbi:MAG: DUF6311 domain-containing protein [Devosia sp.]